MTHGTLLLGNTHLFWDLIWRKNMDTYASPMEYVHKVVKFESHSTCSCISYWPMSTSRWSHSYNIMSKPPSYPSVWSTLSFLYLYWFNIMSLQEDLGWRGRTCGLNGWRRLPAKEAILVSVCALGEGIRGMPYWRHQEQQESRGKRRGLNDVARDGGQWRKVTGLKGK